MPVNSTADMEKKYTDYADAIVRDFLDLRTGDALSINTDESDLEFARLIAQTALPVTDVTVKIVVIENGKPSQVLEFDPAPPAHLPRNAVMLRLSHEKPVNEEKGQLIDIIVEQDDMGALQKLGHLADPLVLDRRIAVPWCVASVWDEDDPAWNSLVSTLDVGVSSLALASRYRSRRLEEMSLADMRITGQDTDLELTVAPSSRFVGGHRVLSSGREFISCVDFDRLSFNADRSSANGRARGTVMVLGKRQEVDLVFDNGRLTEWTHTAEMDRLMDFDENLKRVGYISFRDGEMALHLGGALVEALDILPPEEEMLPDFFNTSLYTLTCTLEKGLDVVCTDSRGIPHEIVRNGLFVE